MKKEVRYEDEYDEEEDDVSYEEDYKNKKRSKQTKKDKRSSKRQKIDARKFVEVEAEEASDIDSDEDLDDENEKLFRTQQHESQYYTNDQLKRRQQGINMNMLQSMEERYRDTVQDDNEFEEDEDQEGLIGEYEGDDMLIDKEKLPSVNDPRLWQVRVKRGCERQATLQLMNKSIDFARRGKHLSILSVTCTEKVEGFIYVEAFKEIHVKEAIVGLSVILGGKCLLIQKEEMPGLYQNDKQTINLQIHQWVRPKQGLYGGDLGLVEATVDDKVYLRLIPRLDFSKDQLNGKGRDDKAKNKFSNQRPSQRIFNKSLVPQMSLEHRQIPALGNKTFDVYKKQYLKNGFLYKSFPSKQLQIDNVRPTIEEVQQFTSYMKSSKDDINQIDETITGEELIRKTFMQGSSSDINKGDKIRVVKGDLNGLYGQVVTIEGSDVLFKPTIEGFEDDLRLPMDFVVKHFEPGDQVRVIDGKFKGETGIVISSETQFANVALTQNNREVRIFANSLKLKSEIDQGVLGMTGYIDKKNFSKYSANDLIMYNTKYVGVVLQVQDDYLKVINNEGDLQNIKLSDINKKIDFSRKTTTVDSHRNTLYADNVVRMTNGKYKGRKGVVKYIFKTTLFLWDKEFYQSNGIFVENARNVVILGDEHMKQNQGGAVANSNRRFRDVWAGKEIEITKGEWKGYRGRVCRADDRQAIVELSSKCRKIPIEISLIKEVDVGKSGTTRGDMTYGGQTVYEAGKTPMQYNTPSYYPHSPHWGANQSPGYGTDYDYNNAGMSPGFSRAGSEHYPNKPQTPRNDNWVKHE